MIIAQMIAKFRSEVLVYFWADITIIFLIYFFFPANQPYFVPSRPYIEQEF